MHSSWHCCRFVKKPIQTFKIIIWLHTGVPHEQIKLVGRIDRIFSDLYPNYDTECTVVASAAGMDKDMFKEYFQPQQERHAIVAVSEEYLTVHKHMLSNFLKEHTGCAVAAFSSGTFHLKNLIDTLRKVKNNFILKLDGVRPKISDMVSSDYPIMWTEENFYFRGKQSNFLGLFCPKEDRSRSDILRVPLIENSKITCPHYLQGQRLGLGHIYKKKRRIINGKAVYGENYVRFFEYASKKFKFEPWFKNGRVIYFPKNESWGGIQGEVSNLGTMVK